MKYFVGLFFGLLIGCSSTIGQQLLRFQDREFIVHPDKPGMGYPHYETKCVPNPGWTRVFRKENCSQVWVDEFYDMNEKKVRDRFIDASCTMTCAGRFQY